MSETPTLAARRSPFGGTRAALAQPNAAGQIGVRLQADMMGSVTQVSTWTSGMPALVQALTAWLGLPPPATTGSTLATDYGLLLRSGPEEFLLIAESVLDNAALLRRQVAGEFGAVTDLSHARCRIRVSGEKTCDTLSKLFPIDLREPAFAVGQARLTGHHHVPALLHRRARDDFDLYVFTTYAQDQWQVLRDAALQYGVSVEV